MHCPYCQHVDTRVIDSRLAGDGNQVRRRRQCPACSERFTTHEVPELVMPRVVKSDGRREQFNEAKLRAGLRRALEKRPVPTEDIEAALHRLCKQISASAEGELDAAVIGEYVMEELRNLDVVAYVRFASVYRRFEDVGAFRRVIEGLEQGQSDHD